MNDTQVRSDAAMRIIVLTTLSTLTLWLGQGCARVNRDRLTVGGEALPTMTIAERPAEATSPSLIAGSRDHWAGHTIVVAVDGTEHQPTYTRLRPRYVESPRTMGVHPTSDSSLDLGSPVGPQVWEGFAAPFHAGLDVVMFIPRAIGAAPWSQTVSPSEPFQRYRAGQTEVPVLTPEAAPIPPAAE